MALYVPVLTRGQQGCWKGARHRKVSPWCGPGSHNYMLACNSTWDGKTGWRRETLLTIHRATLRCVEMMLEAPGDSGGPESLATDEKDLRLSVPLSTAPPSHLYQVDG